MKKKYLFIIPLVLAIGVLSLSHIAYAAPPSIAITQGVVNASVAATYAPTTRGPVSFAASGSCPRWSGTINDTNLASQPINSNITASDLDAGDTVTFAMVLRNTSVDGEAFDIMAQNVLPSGFELPGSGAEGANLCVHDGAGNPISYTSSGAGFFGATTGDHIELTDSGSGALAPDHPTNGENIAVITFDLRVAAHYVPNSTKSTTSEVLAYADAEGGSPIPGSTDSSSVKTGLFGRTKSLSATNQPSTSGNFVTVGEQLTYNLQVHVPHGEVDDVTVVDSMPSGLAFLDCVSITNDDPSEVSTNLAGGITTACNDPTNPTVTSQGTNVTFDIGDLINTNRNDSALETITITYRAVVTNVAAAFTNETLNNSATIRWEGNNSATSVSAPVTVHEPKLQVTSAVSPTSAAIGDTVQLMVTVGHAGNSTTTAQDSQLTVTLPSGLTLVGGSLNCGTGTVVASTCSATGNTITASWASLPLANTGVVTLDTMIDDSAAASVAFNPSLTWSSLPGDVTTPQSTYAVQSVERTGLTSDPGGSQNDYGTSTTTVLATTNAAGENPSPSPGNGQSGDILAPTGFPVWPAIALAVTLILTSSLLGVRYIIRNRA